MVDFALQRKNMVEGQVRPSDITDRRIIRAMLDLPREAFCPPSQRATAYRDEMLALNEVSGSRARFAAAPRTLAKMIQALELRDNDTVMEVGTGTGYGSAILSRMATKVVAVEPDASLATSARANLQAAAASNVTVIEGDSAVGHAPGAPYDAILVNGAAAGISRTLLDQLKDGGRLVAVISNGSFGHLTVWRRLGGTFDAQVLSDAAAPALAEFAKPAQFVF